MIKIEYSANRQSMRAILTKYLFKGNKDKFEVWWKKEPFELSLSDKVLFNFMCESLFEGDYEKCEEFWYNPKVEGLDKMSPSDFCKSVEGKKMLLAWTNGYLTGLVGSKVGEV